MKNSTGDARRRAVLQGAPRGDLTFVDLKIKPMAPGEMRRFVDRFGLGALLDSEGKAYINAGSKYLRPSDAQMLEKIEREPSYLGCR